VKRIGKEDINNIVEAYPAFPLTAEFNVVHIHQNKFFGAGEGRLIAVIDLEAKPYPTWIANIPHNEVNSIINLDDNTLLFGEAGIQSFNSSYLY
jgi:hypothetical protein